MSVFGLGLTSWVGPGKGATPRLRVSSTSRVTCASLSLLVDPSVWVTGGGSVTLNWRGTGNTHSLGVNSPVLGDHLTSSDRKPEGSIKSADFAWTLGVLALGIFRVIFFHRMRIVEGILTGLPLYLRGYLLSSVQVLLTC